MTKSNELIVFEKLEPLKIFTEKGTESILNQIKKEKDNFEGDISTAKGRDEIRSFARKFATSKSKLDELGKNLVSGWKEQAKVVDNERKKIRDTLDLWRDEVRQPLTDFENAEIRRIEDFKGRIKDLEFYRSANYDIIVDSKTATEALSNLDEEYKSVSDWQEFKHKASTEYQKSNLYLCQVQYGFIVKEEEQAELEKLRKEKEEREKKEREEQIIKAAEEKAEIRAKKEQEEAIRLERARAEAERQKEIDETKAREADLEHRTKIYKEIINALLPYVNNNMEANAKTEAIIAGIAKGKIPYISIKY